MRGKSQAEFFLPWVVFISTIIILLLKLSILFFWSLKLFSSVPLLCGHPFMFFLIVVFLDIVLDIRCFFHLYELEWSSLVLSTPILFGLVVCKAFTICLSGGPFCKYSWLAILNLFVWTTCCLWSGYWVLHCRKALSCFSGLNLELEKRLISDIEMATYTNLRGVFLQFLLRVLLKIVLQNEYVGFLQLHNCLPENEHNLLSFPEVIHHSRF